MQHIRRLPSSDEIIRAGMLVRSYPADRRHVVRTARMWNTSQDVIALLREFPAETVFKTRADFVMRTQNMAAQIRQIWERPKQGRLL